MVIVSRTDILTAITKWNEIFGTTQFGSVISQARSLARFPFNKLSQGCETGGKIAQKEQCESAAI